MPPNILAEQVHHTVRQPTLLFGVDLEDIRHRFSGGETFASVVPEMTKNLLDFLEQHHVAATFFCEGRTVDEFPSLIGEISARGHEIACHTYSHRPLFSVSVDEFRRDLEQNIETIYKATSLTVKGFRAPFFSSVPKTKWLYSVLREFGFTYSSSVLDGRWPVAGWPGFFESFEAEARGSVLTEGIVEIPITSLRIGAVGIPVAGGIYARLLPGFFLRLLWRRFLQNKRAISTYIHPYDIDLSKPDFRHPEFQRNALFNLLMHVGRAGLLDKFAGLLEQFPKRSRYDDFVSEHYPEMRSRGDRKVKLVTSDVA